MVGFKRSSRGFIFICCVFILIVFIWLSLSIGSVSITQKRLLYLIFSHDTYSTDGFILWNIRIPRTIAAVLGGGFLGVSGLLLQIFFRNPLAGPFILGISSGATLVVALVMLTSIALGFTQIAPYLTTLSALFGAYITMFIVLIVATRVKNPITLLIIGLMIGYLCQSVTSILMAFAEQERIKGFVLWQMGSFSGFKWSEIRILTFVGLIILICTYLISKPLNGLLLGDIDAKSLGVRVKMIRFLIVLFSCALSGLVTAGAGPVAFIGIAIPHMGRLIFSTSDNRVLVPGVFLLAGIVTGVSDLIARSIFSPVEVPISAVTAIFGAPIIIALVSKRKMEI